MYAVNTFPAFMLSRGHSLNDLHLMTHKYLNIFFDTDTTNMYANQRLRKPSSLYIIGLVATPHSRSYREQQKKQDHPFQTSYASLSPAYLASPMQQSGRLCYETYC